MRRVFGGELVMAESQITMLATQIETFVLLSYNFETLDIGCRNMVVGVNTGYKKELQIQGVGYKAQMKGADIVLSLGFSHDIIYNIPEGIKVAVDGGTTVTIEGIDKQMVGQVAARIRDYSPAEPYKGKGVRYTGEQVRRKEGKAVA